MATKEKGVNVRAELVRVTKVKQNEGESLKAYQYRMCDAISDLNDEEFGKFSKEARDWYNEAADALSDESKKPHECNIPPFPGEEEGAAVSATEEKGAAATSGEASAGATAEEKAPAPAESKSTKKGKEKKVDESKKDEGKKAAATKASGGKKGGGKKAAAAKKPKAAKPAAKKDDKAETKKRGDGIADRIRLAVAKQPSITFEKLCEKLEIPKSEQRPGSYAWTRFNDASRSIGIYIETVGK